MKLSIVVAMYNEEDNVGLLVDAIHQAIGEYSYEIILVNDGSSDKTVENIIALNDEKVKLVDLRRNYGQSPALSAGINHADGEWIVTMDGDLQNDPSDIPMMLELAEKDGWDVVAGIRAKRKDGMFLRKVPSKIANWIIRRSTGLHMKDLGCALKIFRSEIAKDIGLYGELHRFIAILAHFEGAKIHQVDVKHHARRFGKSKYGINRTFKVMSDLLLMIFMKKYLQKPIHLFGTLGLGVFGAGVLIDIYMLVLKVLGYDIADRPMMILGIFLTLAGLQFITVGIITELQMRTYYESQDKKPYRVKNIWIGNKKKEA